MDFLTAYKKITHALAVVAVALGGYFTAYPDQFQALLNFLRSNPKTAALASVAAFLLTLYHKPQAK